MPNNETLKQYVIDVEVNTKKALEELDKLQEKVDKGVESGAIKKNAQANVSQIEGMIKGLSDSVAKESAAIKASLAKSLDGLKTGKLEKQFQDVNKSISGITDKINLLSNALDNSDFSKFENYIQAFISPMGELNKTISQLTTTLTSMVEPLQTISKMKIGAIDTRAFEQSVDSLKPITEKARKELVESVKSLSQELSGLYSEVTGEIDIESLGATDATEIKQVISRIFDRIKSESKKYAFSVNDIFSDADLGIDEANLRRIASGLDRKLAEILPEGKSRSGRKSGISASTTIKITPTAELSDEDVNKFVEELSQKIETKIQGKLSDKTKIKIPIVPDTVGLKKLIEDAVREYNKTAKTDSAAQVDVPISIKIDQESLNLAKSILQESLMEGEPNVHVGGTTNIGDIGGIATEATLVQIRDILAGGISVVAGVGGNAVTISANNVDINGEKADSKIKEYDYLLRNQLKNADNQRINAENEAKYKLEQETVAGLKSIIESFGKYFNSSYIKGNQKGENSPIELLKNNPFYTTAVAGNEGYAKYGRGLRIDEHQKVLRDTVQSLHDSIKKEVDASISRFEKLKNSSLSQEAKDEIVKELQTQQEEVNLSKYKKEHEKQIEVARENNIKIEKEELKALEEEIKVSQEKTEALKKQADIAQKKIGTAKTQKTNDKYQGNFDRLIQEYWSANGATQRLIEKKNSLSSKGNLSDEELIRQVINQDFEARIKKVQSSNKMTKEFQSILESAELRLTKKTVDQFVKDAGSGLLKDKSFAQSRMNALKKSLATGSDVVGKTVEEQFYKAFNVNQRKGKSKIDRLSNNDLFKLFANANDSNIVFDNVGNIIKSIGSEEAQANAVFQIMKRIREQATETEQKYQEQKNILDQIKTLSNDKTKDNSEEIKALTSENEFVQKLLKDNGDIDKALKEFNKIYRQAMSGFNSAQKEVATHVFSEIGSETNYKKKRQQLLDKQEQLSYLSGLNAYGTGFAPAEKQMLDSLLKSVPLLREEVAAYEDINNISDRVTKSIQDRVSFEEENKKVIAEEVEFLKYGFSKKGNEAYAGITDFGKSTKELSEQQLKTKTIEELTQAYEQHKIVVAEASETLKKYDDTEKLATERAGDEIKKRIAFLKNEKKAIEDNIATKEKQSKEKGYTYNPESDKKRVERIEQSIAYLKAGTGMANKELEEKRAKLEELVKLITEFESKETFDKKDNSYLDMLEKKASLEKSIAYLQSKYEDENGKPISFYENTYKRVLKDVESEKTSLSSIVKFRETELHLLEQELAQRKEIEDIDTKAAARVIKSKTTKANNAINKEAEPYRDRINQLEKEIEDIRKTEYGKRIDIAQAEIEKQQKIFDTINKRNISYRLTHNDENTSKQIEELENAQKALDLAKRKKAAEEDAFETAVRTQRQEISGIRQIVRGYDEQITANKKKQEEELRRLEIIKQQQQLTRESQTVSVVKEKTDEVKAAEAAKAKAKANYESLDYEGKIAYLEKQIKKATGEQRVDLEKKLEEVRREYVMQMNISEEMRKQKQLGEQTEFFQKEAGERAERKAKKALQAGTITGADGVITGNVALGDIATETTLRQILTVISGGKVPTLGVTGEKSKGGITLSDDYKALRKQFADTQNMDILKEMFTKFPDQAYSQYRLKENKKGELGYVTANGSKVNEEVITFTIKKMAEWGVTAEQLQQAINGVNEASEKESSSAQKETEVKNEESKAADNASKSTSKKTEAEKEATEAEKERIKALDDEVKKINGKKGVSDRDALFKELFTANPELFERYAFHGNTQEGYKAYSKSGKQNYLANQAEYDAETKAIRDSWTATFEELFKSIAKPAEKYSSDFKKALNGLLKSDITDKQKQQVVRAGASNGWVLGKGQKGGEYFKDPRFNQITEEDINLTNRYLTAKNKLNSSILETARAEGEAIKAGRTKAKVLTEEEQKEKELRQAENDRLKTLQQQVDKINSYKTVSAKNKNFQKLSEENSDFFDLYALHGNVQDGYKAVSKTGKKGYLAHKEEYDAETEAIRKTWQVAVEASNAIQQAEEAEGKAAEQSAAQVVQAEDKKQKAKKQSKNNTDVYSSILAGTIKETAKEQEKYNASIDKTNQKIKVWFDNINLLRTKLFDNIENPDLLSKVGGMISNLQTEISKLQDTPATSDQIRRIETSFKEVNYELGRAKQLSNEFAKEEANAAIEAQKNAELLQKILDVKDYGQSSNALKEKAVAEKETAEALEREKNERIVLHSLEQEAIENAEKQRKIEEEQYDILQDMVRARYGQLDSPYYWSQVPDTEKMREQDAQVEEIKKQTTEADRLAEEARKEIDQWKFDTNELSKAYSDLVNQEIKLYNLSKQKNLSIKQLQDEENEVKRLRQQLEDLSKAYENTYHKNTLDSALGNASKQSLGKLEAVTRGNTQKILTKYESKIEKLTPNQYASVQQVIDQLEKLDSVYNDISAGGIMKYINSVNMLQDQLTKLVTGISDSGVIDRFDKIDASLNRLSDVGFQSDKIELFKNRINEIAQAKEKLFSGWTGSGSDLEGLERLEKDLSNLTAHAKDFKETIGGKTFVDIDAGNIKDVDQLAEATFKLAKARGYTKVGLKAYDKAQDHVTITARNQKGELIELTTAMNKFNNSMYAGQPVMKQNISFWKTYGATIKQAFSTFGYYLGFAALIRKTMQEFRQGITTLKEFDSALTTISYTMNLSQEELKDLGNSAIDMAEDLSMSMENALKVYQIYANMKTTAQEIEEVARPTAILSNLSGVDASTAADQVQGILQQFNMLKDGEEDLAETSMHIVDVLDKISANVAIDYSKGIGIISEAVTATGQVAHDAGMSFEELAAITAKVAERTREDGSTIGNAMKTMFVRISKVSKMPQYVDEVDNEQISKAAKALHDIGIEVYNANGEFNNITDTLTQLNDKWDSLNDVQKSNIAFQVAATRQSAKFKSMLEAWTGAMSLANEATEANGNALENQEKYEDSYIGKLQRLETEWKEFWLNLLNSDEFKKILDILIKIVSKINEFADSTNHAGLVLAGLGLASVVATLAKMGRQWLVNVTGIKALGDAAADAIPKIAGLATALESASAASSMNVATSTGSAAVSAITKAEAGAMISEAYLQASGAGAAMDAATYSSVKFGRSLEELKAIEKGTAVSTMGMAGAMTTAGAAGEGAMLGTATAASSVIPIIIGLIGVVALLTAEFNKANVTVQELEDQINETRSTIEEIQDEISELQEIESKTIYQENRLALLKEELSVHEKILEKRKALLKEERIGSKFTDRFDSDNYANKVAFETGEIIESSQGGLKGIISNIVGSVITGVKWFFDSDDSAKSSVASMLDKQQSYRDALVNLKFNKDSSKDTEYRTALTEARKEYENAIKDAELQVMELQALIYQMDEDNVDKNSDTYKQAQTALEEYQAFVKEAQKEINIYDFFESSEFLKAVDYDVDKLKELINAEKDDYKLKEKIELNYPDLINLMKEEGITLDNLIGKYKEYAEEKERAFVDSTVNYSKSEMIDAITEMTTGFDKLDEIYADIYDKESFDFTKLATKGFKEAFADLEDEYVEFIESVSANPDNIEAAQEAFNKLAQAYIDNSGALKGLTEENKQVTIDMLRNMGIANAEEVVLGELAAKEETLADEKAYATKYSKTLENATVSEIDALIQEQGHSEKTANALKLLALEKMAVNGSVLDTSADLAALTNFIEGIGGATSALQALQKMKAGATVTLASKGYDTTLTEEQYKNNLEKAAQAEYDAAVKKLKDAANAKITPVQYTGGDKTKDAIDKANKSGEESKEIFDWIEKALQRQEEEINRIDKVVNATYKDWSKRNSSLLSELDEVNKEIAMQRTAYQAYMRDAEAIPLSEEYKKLVREGAMKSEIISDKTLKKNIKEYEELYDKAIKAKDAVADLEAKLASLAKLKFDNVKSEFEGFTSEIEHFVSMIDKQLSHVENMNKIAGKSFYNAKMEQDTEKINSLYQEREALMQSLRDAEANGIEAGSADWIAMRNDIYAVDEAIADLTYEVEDLKKKLKEVAKLNFDNLKEQFENALSIINNQKGLTDAVVSMVETSGHMASRAYYESLIEGSKATVTGLRKEYETLTKALADAIAAGDIKEYDEQWYQMQSDIAAVKNELVDAANATIEYANALRQINWDVFDRGLDTISKLVDESEFFVELLSYDDLFDKDTGDWTNAGITTRGLMVEEFQAYMDQANAYGKEAQEIKKLLESDPKNTTLIDRYYELIEAQRQAILNTKKEQKAVQDLYKQAYDNLLERIKKLIDKYKEALQASKDLYDYENTIQEKNKTINDIRKQLLAYGNGNDTSEENRATLQKLNAELATAQKDLEQTEYDKYIQDQQNLLDQFYAELQEWIDGRLDNLEALFQEAIEATNLNGLLIDNTLHETADSVNYQMTEEFLSIWDKYASADSFAGMTYDILTLTNDTTTGIRDKMDELPTEANLAAYFDGADLLLLEQIASAENNTNNMVNAINMTNEGINRVSSNIVELTNTLGNKIDYVGNQVANAINSLDFSTGSGSYNSSGGGSGNGGGSGFSDSNDSSTNSNKNSTSDYSRYKVTGYDEKGYAVNADFGKNYQSAQSYYNSLRKRGGSVRLVPYAKGGLIGKDDNIFDAIARLLGEDHMVAAKEGERILTEDQNKNFEKMVNANFIPLDENAKDKYSMLSGVAGKDITSNLANIPTPEIGNLTNVGNTTTVGDVTITLPNVTDKEEFVEWLKNDGQIERIIQSMTIGRLSGGNSYAKLRY